MTIRSTLSDVRPVRGILAVAATAILLGGCAATAPLSILQDRYVYYPANLDRYPVVVTKIDDRSNTFSHPVIDPGEHVVRFATTPVGGFPTAVEKAYRMNIAPCTRYYVAAQRATSLSQDWDLVVERTDDVGGCNADNEMKKAGLPPVPTGTPIGTSVLEAGPPPVLVKTYPR